MKASAIGFTNKACPTGESRDYIGICFTINECNASETQEPASRATQKAQGNTPLPMAVPLERSKTIWESVFP